MCFSELYLFSSILSHNKAEMTFCILLIFIISSSEGNNALAINIIIANRNVTIGTDEADLINGCSYQKPECSQGSMIDGLEDKDVIQGSSADDTLLGDNGDDDLTGGDGNDRLLGEEGRDVLQAGFGGDLLIAGTGNDELYAGPGDDVLAGGKGSDYFDCGEGYDSVIDFNPTKGDTTADNCEVILTHSAYNINLLCLDRENSIKHNYQSSVLLNSTESSNDTGIVSNSITSSMTVTPILPQLDCTNDDDVSISVNDGL